MGTMAIMQEKQQKNVFEIEWTFLRSFCHSGCTVLANRAGWQVADDLMPLEAPDNSWYWVFVYLEHVVVQLLIGGKYLEAGAAREGQKKWQKGPRRIWPSRPPPPPGCPVFPPHPSPSPPSPQHHHHPPSSPPPPSPPPSGGLEGLQALPPLMQGPVGQTLGCLHTGLLASSSPKVPK